MLATIAKYIEETFPNYRVCPTGALGTEGVVEIKIPLEFLEPAPSSAARGYYVKRLIYNSPNGYFLFVNMGIDEPPLGPAGNIACTVHPSDPDFFKEVSNFLSGN